MQASTYLATVEKSGEDINVVIVSPDGVEFPEDYFSGGSAILDCCQDCRFFAAKVTIGDPVTTTAAYSELVGAHLVIDNRNYNEAA